MAGRQGKKVLMGDEATESLRKRSMAGGGSTFWWPGKEPGEVGRRRARLSSQTVQCLYPCSFSVLSLRLELFPEGPLQLGDRQSEGEGAV